MKSAKIKSHKLIILLLAIVVLANLNFCLAAFVPYAQAAETKEMPAADNISSENDITFANEQNCQDNHNVQPEETKTAENKSVPSNDTVLPCCRDHDQTSKIDSAQNYKLNNPIFFILEEINTGGKLTESQNSLNKNAIDLPPPEANLLSSIFKKE